MINAAYAGLSTLFVVGGCDENVGGVVVSADRRGGGVLRHLEVF